MNDLISVIILTCGKNNYFVSCLESVVRQTHPHFEIICIDNSLDPAVSRAALKICPALNVFSSERNLYYCEGMNKGIEMSCGDFILCLNDDVTLDPHFLQEAMKGFLRGDKIGMVSGKVLRQDGVTLDSTGLFLSVWRTAKERGYGVPDRKQFEVEEEVFGVTGAAAFYRRRMLEDIKEAGFWFDPSFNIFFEDLDISWRANRRGWKAYYMPRATAYHVRGGSVRKGSGVGKSCARKYLSDTLHKDLIKNRYLTIIKNETLAGFLAHGFPMFFYDLCSWLFILFQKPRVIALFFAEASLLSRAIRKRFAKKEVSVPPAA